MPTAVVHPGSENGGGSQVLTALVVRPLISRHFRPKAWSPSPLDDFCVRRHSQSAGLANAVSPSGGKVGSPPSPTAVSTYAAAAVARKTGC